MKTELIPVIHMININQVMTNVQTCVKNDVRKVFIINHEVDANSLLECAELVKKKYPTLWVGVNILGEPAEDLILRNLNVDGIWCDETIKPEFTRKYKGMLFGGLAFKYQPQPKDLKASCEESIKTTDVSTTSGVGTGREADITKIMDIRKYLGEHPMAIASGVNNDNISSYIGIVNYLLVASSITSRSEMIYEDKLIELLNKIRK